MCREKLKPLNLKTQFISGRSCPVMCCRRQAPAIYIPDPRRPQPSAPCRPIELMPQPDFSGVPAIIRPPNPIAKPARCTVAGMPTPAIPNFNLPQPAASFPREGLFEG